MNLLARCVVAGLLLLVSLRSIPASAQKGSDTSQLGYTVIPSVTYSQPDGPALEATLYLPRAPGLHPAVLFIHGGGWSSGDRNQLHRQAAYMAERGMVGMEIDYRLAPAHPYPAALQDSREAMLWLRQNASAYHIDPDHIGVVGSSAGAYLAAMLGVESDTSHHSKATVQAVVALNGIFDLTTMPPGPMITGFVGRTCTDAPQVCREASPVNHIQAGEPPFFIMHGDADQTAPYAQAKTFVEALTAMGDQVELYTVANGPHTFWSKPQWAAISDQKMAEFLERTLKNNPLAYH